MIFRGNLPGLTRNSTSRVWPKERRDAEKNERYLDVQERQRNGRDPGSQCTIFWAAPPGMARPKPPPFRLKTDGMESLIKPRREGPGKGGKRAEGGRIDGGRREGRIDSGGIDGGRAGGLMEGAGNRREEGVGGAIGVEFRRSLGGQMSHPALHSTLPLYPSYGRCVQGRTVAHTPVGRSLGTGNPPPKFDPAHEFPHTEFVP
ncbi:hypothetical protein BJ322DRAFT_1154260 [Thelephora terrestris]|uniref:Uncharacterized protein n=1 Tax=Thelephora terrestris TaxID=56493 RepID=A0A9P6HX26_9AGAM|nr:hypothetical protein BJ322DRAFT_1154260 [Thelephora terrestris]